VATRLRLRFWADDLRVAGPMRQTWIDICQKANIDPKALIEKHVDKLLKLVLESTTVEARVSQPLDVFCSPE
jgi:hypothetical protein